MNIDIGKTTVSLVNELFKNLTAPPEILVVDDDQYILDVFSSGISKLGLSVIVAHTGEDAVVIYKNKMKEHFQDKGATAHPFDLVMLDLRMPGMTGEHVLAEIRGLWPLQPIVIVSGYIENFSSLTNYGPVVIMNKPISFSNIKDLFLTLNIRMRGLKMPKAGDSTDPFGTTT